MGNTIDLEEIIIVGSNICELGHDSMTYADDGQFVLYQFAKDIDRECFNIMNGTKNKFVYMKVWHHKDIIFVIEQYCCSKYVRETDEKYILHKKYFEDNK